MLVLGLHLQVKDRRGQLEHLRCVCEQYFTILTTLQVQEEKSGLTGFDQPLSLVSVPSRELSQAQRVQLCYRHIGWKIRSRRIPVLEHLFGQVVNNKRTRHRPKENRL